MVDTDGRALMIQAHPADVQDREIAETVIAPSLSGLYQRYPQLHLDLRVDDHVADMARDGIDIAVRTGTVGDDALVARRIGGFT